MKLEELVKHNLSWLNETDLIVWRYIYAHLEECCYISIYDLADACHVSRTTVMRFAKKLGFDGFSDLKAVLKMEYAKPHDKPTQTIAEATTALCQAIGEEIAKQDFERVNRLMHRARRVFVFASGLVQRNIANELTRLQSNSLARLSTENLYVTPRALPVASKRPYESTLAFFLMVEIWFVSYTQFLAEQDGDSEDT